ncbi:hypothetical protein Q7P37_010382 [Cladosporium fusiforme]
MAKAHIVLVHGAYHQPLHWDALVEVLHAAGHTTSTPKLPSVNSTPTPGALAKDIAAIQQDIATAIDQGATSIIPVFHSYGSIPGFDALATLKPNQKVKIPRSICISAFVAPKGTHLVDAVSRGSKNYTKIEASNTIHMLLSNTNYPYFTQNGLVTVPDPIPTFYNDISPTEATKAATALLPSAAEAFVTPVEHEGWAEFPVTYILCSRDEALSVEMQQEAIETCRGRAGRTGGPGAVDVETLDSSHSPMLSMPDQCARLIRKASGEEV